MFLGTVALFALLGLSQAKPTHQVLGHDDVLLLRDGKALVMKSWDYQLEEDKREVQRRKAGHLPTKKASDLKARGCEESSEVQVITDTYFNNWDVAMSPVIANTGGPTVTLAVSKGYSISNSVEVSAGVSVTMGTPEIKNLLSYTIKVSESTSWSTTDSQTFSFFVPSGQYGVVVSQPYTHRIAGNVLTGCTDSPSVSTFVSDSYTSQTYGELSWVEGPIVLCNSSSYPVPYCIGTGEHQ